MGQELPIHDPHRLKLALQRLRDSDCIGCPEVSVRSGMDTRTAMPVNRPRYVDQAVQMLHPEALEERHSLDPDSDCINPKCNFRMDQIATDEANSLGSFTCPQCNTMNTIEERNFAAGGNTRAGLTLDQMGNLGEEIVFRMGELPGVGVISQTFPSTGQKNEQDGTVDMIVTANDGTRFGCEIKTNHSLAQERFKVGDKADRLSKLKYCAANGLKPAIVGVRLNFFTDRASIFFRDGLTDTWIGNSRMRHIANVDFSDLNPFQLPDPQQKQEAVEQAHLPDQSSDEDEFDAIFGPLPQQQQQPEFAALATRIFSSGENHAEHEDGRFTFKDHQHEVKVLDAKGDHKTTIKRCKGCGVLYERAVEHKGAFGCPTCGDDPELVLVLAKVIVSSPLDQPVDLSAWQDDGVTANGHRRYVWLDPTGYKHIVVGNSQRKKVEMDAAHTQQRMRQCMLGKCTHARNVQPTMQVEGQPGNGVWRPGDQVNLNGAQGIVVEVEGSLAVVQNLATGQEDVVPTATLERSAAKGPDFLFVFYMGKLKVEPYHHNTKHADMIETLLKEHGHTEVGDPTHVAAGEVFEYSDGSLKIEHKGLSAQDVREEAEKAIREWVKDKDDVLPEDEGDDDDEPGEDWPKEEGKLMDFSDPDHWRRLPRDEDGQWMAL